MGMVIYRQNEYAVQEVQSSSRKGFILFNTKKPFEEGHTHLNNFASARYLIGLAVHEKLPYDLDRYRMTSLARILEDGEFRDRVIALLEVKNARKPQTYVNRSI